MAKIEESVIINWPVDQVFNYVTDFDRLPEWETNILKSEKTSAGKIGIGTTYRGVIKAMGMRMEWTSIVTKYEENTRLDETITSGKTIIYEKLMFDIVDEDTEFTLIHDYRTGGFLKLITPMLVYTMRKQMKANLGNLKRILEKDG
ncbi:SRPBCC family protein [Chloroflexota bacterium]